MPRLKWPFVVAIIMYCVAIFALSSQSEPPTPPPAWWDWPGADKIAHVVIFGGLSALVALGLWRSNDGVQPARLFLLPVLFTVAYGLSDELHQLYVPNRTFDTLDLLADAVGATITAGAASLYAAKCGGSRAPDRVEKGP